MFALVYCNDGQLLPLSTDNGYRVLFQAAALEEVAKNRQVSGDLVVDLWTKEIVQDDSWLFDWEKEKPDCYARRKMAANYKLNRQLF